MADVAITWQKPVLSRLVLLGAPPTWPYRSGRGYCPGGGLGLVVVILIILLLLSKI